MMEESISKSFFFFLPSDRAQLALLDSANQNPPEKSCRVILPAMLSKREQLLHLRGLLLLLLTFSECSKENIPK
jgi:hypothetical protein